jgi:hypothetical protein
VLGGGEQFEAELACLLGRERDRDRAAGSGPGASTSARVTSWAQDPSGSWVPCSGSIITL